MGHSRSSMDKTLRLSVVEEEASVRVCVCARVGIVSRSVASVGL